MAVYLIHAVGTQLYKVGTARDPDKRLRDLQTSSPLHLELIAAIKGGHDIEHAIHRALHAQRAKGEWFEIDGEPDEAALLEWATWTPPPAVPVEPTEHPDIVGLAEICRRLGRSRSVVDQWKWRGDLPEPRWTVGGRPAWDWADIEAWARATGRLE